MGPRTSSDSGKDKLDGRLPTSGLLARVGDQLNVQRVSRQLDTMPTSKMDVPINAGSCQTSITNSRVLLTALPTIHPCKMNQSRLPALNAIFESIASGLAGPSASILVQAFRNQHPNRVIIYSPEPISVGVLLCIPSMCMVS